MMARGSVAIVGVGETPVGKHPGRTSLQLYAEVATKAIADAGLTKDDIDGVITGGTFLESTFMHSAVFGDYLGLQPTYSTTLDLGGMAYTHALIEAAGAIESGMCSTVLVAAADPLLSFGAQPAIDLMAAFFSPDFELPFGFTTPVMFAFAARRHMSLYGTTREQLAQVAVSARKHASLNPLAQYRKPLTVYDVCASREVCTPLRVFDCSPISDGGGAFIVARRDLAARSPKTPAFVLGMGEGHDLNYTNRHRDITESASAASIAGRKALTMAGLRTEDMDFAEIYDCFTITLIVTLEALGFCQKGEGGAFVENGRIELGGELPVNTHGGLLSHGHPGVPAGIFHIIEAVKQLRGEVEPERQVPAPEVCLVHGNSALFRDGATVILANAT